MGGRSTAGQCHPLRTDECSSALPPHTEAGGSDAPEFRGALRAVALDEYLEDLRVTAVPRNEGWAEIGDLPRLFPELAE